MNIYNTKIIANTLKIKFLIIFSYRVYLKISKLHSFILSYMHLLFNFELKCNKNVFFIT